MGAYVKNKIYDRMDVARFMIRTNFSWVLNQSINVEVNDHVYEIKLVEDMHGPKHKAVLNDTKVMDSSEGSSLEEDVDDDNVWSVEEKLGSDDGDTNS